MLFKTLALGLLCAVGVSGAAISLEERATCVYTCGSVCYWQSDIDDALAKGYSLYQSGSTLNDYPHQYNDYEGFSFPTSSPWYEFPILSTYKVYTGGSPGADRVIFDSKGNFDALITHTGASGNNFVACSAA
ncbi:hypothetical protein NKR23_g12151 [Pleurostoma richardsiae]|uniref:ribonuclease T1 n=1 Tax=Pleurostoma richardsiae TaxID=41990 RepID=A0AA38VD17_9PEZI|nr:hypothetical protein NKR23_g12151 [Pleurostoma richardsiae]